MPTLSRAPLALRGFLLSVVVFAALSVLRVGHAQETVTAGTLIRGSRAAVYYYGADGRRYVFPNERTYRTWYANFSTVQRVSDVTIGNIDIGGNVTYRPGVKLVKIVSAPQVYAVDRGGTLRWVETEALARTLYGPHWARAIDDIPDAFFVNYRVGAPIRSPSDYSPSAARDAVTTIAIDRNITTPVAAVPSPGPPSSGSTGSTAPSAPASGSAPSSSPGTSTPPPVSTPSAPSSGSTTPATPSPQPSPQPQPASPSSTPPPASASQPAPAIVTSVDPRATSGPNAPDGMGSARTGGVVIASLEIRNDRATDRPDELAYASIPVVQSRNLLTTDRLALVGPGEQSLNVQFRPTARWGGGPSDGTRPIRWLEVAVRANVPAQQSVRYSLRQFDPPVSRPSVLARGTGNSWTIDTGAATFTIDGGSPSVLSTIRMGNRIVYANTTDAGPRVMTSQGNVLRATVDAGGFAIEDNGPVKAIVRSRGHFAAGTSPCAKPLAYDARMTFVRGSANVTLEFDVRNECGDGFSLDWQANRALLNAIEWHFPVALDAASQRSFLATDTQTTVSAAGAPGAVTIEQRRGSALTTGWRRARALRDGVVVATSTAFAKPLVAVGDANVTASIQVPWMQWREPQALTSQGNTLIVRFLSESDAIGEAQARWHFAQLRFSAGAASLADLERERDRGILELERGLLIHAPVAYVNATKVMPRLPERTNDATLNRYAQHIAQAHADTVPSQWIRNKTFGIIWPDTPVFTTAVSSPAEASITSNYWSPTSSEVLEFFRTGDPKWYWDFAFPQEQTLWKTAVYSAGTQTQAGDIRTGFGVGRGETAPAGAAYRYNTSSDDYFYNQGSDEVYVVRPSGSLEASFARSCATFIDRYSAPRNQGGQWVSKMEVTRQVSQHLNALRYGAEFIRDPAVQASCMQKLHAVMQEYAEDNFKGNIFCIADSGNEASCETDDSFMHAAMHLDPFLGYLFSFGDRTVQVGGRTLTDVIRSTIVNTARQYDQVMLTKSGGSYDVLGDWFNAVRCTFAEQGVRVTGCSGIRFGEPLYDHARPMALASMLIAHELDPSVNLCSAAAEALPRSMDGEFSSFYGNGNGWVKGTSQAMRLIAHGIGVAETCVAATPTSTASPSTSATPTTPAPSSTPVSTTPAPTPVASQPSTNTVPAAPTTGLPASTYTLQRAETIDFYAANAPWTLVFGHEIGTGGCFGTDWVQYDLYLAQLGASRFERVGGHTGAAVGQFTGGHVMESQGCAKGAFLYTLARGTYDAVVCITNTRNTSQRTCTSPVRVTAS